LISIVIPTFNEKENLEELLRRVDSSLRGIDYEVVIVDDNSPDGTAEEALKLSERYPVRVMLRAERSGLSSAVLDGMKMARGDIICVMDADLQHPPELLKELYERILEGDIVIASRYVKGGSVEGWSFLRRLISRASILLARLLIPKVRGIRDTSSGYFMIKRECLDPEINPRGFKILLEILAKTECTRIYEVPYSFGLRKHGESKLGLSTMINYLLQLLELSPFIKFSIIGALGTLVNLLSLYAMRYLIGLEHELASIIAIEISLLNNFTLNDIWTFRKRRRGSLISSLLNYHLANLIGITTQFLVSMSLHRFIGVESILSQFIGIIMGFIVNYSLSRRIVWW